MLQESTQNKRLEHDIKFSLKDFYPKINVDKCSLHLGCGKYVFK